MNLWLAIISFILAVLVGGLRYSSAILNDALSKRKHNGLATVAFVLTVFGALLAAAPVLFPSPAGQGILIWASLLLTLLGLGVAVWVFYPLRGVFWLKGRRALYLRQIMQAFVLNPYAVRDIGEIKTTLEQSVGEKLNDRDIRGLVNELVSQRILQEVDR